MLENYTKKLEKFKNLYLTKFPNSNLEILDFDLTKKDSFIINSEYGLCSIYKGNLLNGSTPNIKNAINKLEFFKNMYNKKFPQNSVEIVGFSERVLSNGAKNLVIIKTKYGFCEIIKQHLMKGDIGTVQSAIDKQEYVSNQIKEVFPDLKLIEVLDNDFVIVENNYGTCKVKRGEILRNIYPTIQSATDKQNYFKNQCLLKYNSVYDYSKVDYKHAHCKVTIICNKHGEFEQTPANHLRGTKCPKCSYENLCNSLPERFNTHKSEEWFNQAINSKNFDSFKCYIIKCKNNEETFYKIGKTFQLLSNRFQKSFKFSINYNYEIISIFEEKELTIESSKKISDIEKQLQKLNKQFKYKPKIEFGGWNECYSNLLYLTV